MGNQNLTVALPRDGCQRFSKRLISLLDFLFALFGLAAAAPLVALSAVLILAEDGWPFLFFQHRIGLGGKAFRLWKLRSMRRTSNGPLITGADDRRIIRVGRVIRRYKIDELPQLWNVLVGDMSLVGPRPEIPDFVNMSDPVWKLILSVKPGVTDIATLVYRDEEKLLSGLANREDVYRKYILPAKLALNVKYVARPSLKRYLKLLLWTVRYSFLPAGFDANRVRHSFD